MTQEDHCLWCMTSRQGEATCPSCGRRRGEDVEPHPMYLAAGTVLDGKYLLGRVLGHGSFGITYLGLDVHLDFRVAIKEYLPRDLATRAPDGSSVSAYRGEAAEDFRFGLKRFLEEGRNLARFREHPRVVGVYNFFEANGTGYLVMSYLEGKSLEEHRAAQHDGRLPETEAREIMAAVLEGLETVHAEGMLHRDVKPANIYLTRDGGVKLLDFGAARYATGQRSRSLTQIWTPGYAPFEQCLGGGEQGPWSDVYAAGATLYHLLTGEVPTESNVRAVKDVLSSPREVAGAAVGERVSAAVMQALAVDPQERFQSAGACRTALMEAGKGVDVGTRLDAEPPAGEMDKTDRDRSPAPASKSGVAVDDKIENLDKEERPAKGQRAVIDDILPVGKTGALDSPGKMFWGRRKAPEAEVKIPTFRVKTPRMRSRSWKKPLVYCSIASALAIVLAFVGFHFWESYNDRTHFVDKGDFVDNGNGTITDKRTGLMWAKMDNGKNINWDQAEAYCEILTLAGYSDWRLPTLDELEGLYDKRNTMKTECCPSCSWKLHINPIFELTCYCQWSSKVRGFSSAGLFDFDNGRQLWFDRGYAGGRRALPVRSRR